MAEKRKWKVVVYSTGYGSELIREFTWAYSKRQALSFVERRLREAGQVEKLAMFHMQDLPISVSDVTDEDEHGRVMNEFKRQDLVRSHPTVCPKCGYRMEEDYCQNCGFSALAGASGWLRRAMGKTGHKAIGRE